MKKSNQLNNQSIFVTKERIGRSYCEQLIIGDKCVYFINKDKNIKKLIVDKDGNIQNFPNIEYHPDFIEEYGEHQIKNVVKFDAEFYKTDSGLIMMVWTIRPDGRFWMDSWGFGAEDYCDISFYTYLDQNGDYTQPFKLYNIGDKSYKEDKC